MRLTGEIVWFSWGFGKFALILQKIFLKINIDYKFFLIFAKNFL